MDSIYMLSRTSKPLGFGMKVTPLINFSTTKTWIVGKKDPKAYPYQVYLRDIFKLI